MNRALPIFLLLSLAALTFLHWQRPQRRAPRPDLGDEQRQAPKPTYGYDSEPLAFEEEGEDSSLPAVWDVMALPSQPAEEQRPPQPQTPRAYPAAVLAAQRRCKFDTGSYLRAADSNSTAAKHVTAFLHFLEVRAYRKLGFLYLLRDGSLLGAVRNGGMIPDDADLDAVLLLPLDMTLEQVHAAVEAELRALRSPFQLLINDDGRSRWLAMLRTAPDGTVFHMDLTVYPSQLFVGAPIRGFKGDLIYPTRVQAAFTALCRCTYFPLRTNCFDHAEAYLTSIYGDFRSPSKTHAYMNILEEVYV